MTTNELFTLPRDAYIRKHFARLMGKPIGISESARKYAVSQPLVSGWVKHSLIHQIGTTPNHKQKKLINEAEAAYCAAVYHARGGRRGQWLFAEDGSPYQTAKMKEITGG